jgi:soluble lytic murein transglycosylase-like protein
LPLHTHFQIRKAILIVVIFAIFAWLVMVVADTDNAGSNTNTSSAAVFDAAAHPNAVPGSSLEGINEPLAAIIAAQKAAEAEAARQAALAEQKAQAARVAAQQRPTAPPAVRSAPTTQCPAEIVDLIHKYWDRFGVDVANWAIGIAWRESNCRPDVTSPSQCAGVFQTAVPLHGGLYASLGYDWRTAAWQAEPNIAVAAALYASSGPGPWRL